MHLSPAQQFCCNVDEMGKYAFRYIHESRGRVHLGRGSECGAKTELGSNRQLVFHGRYLRELLLSFLYSMEELLAEQEPFQC